MTYTVTEAARELGVSVGMIYSLIRDMILSGQRNDKGHWLLKESDVNSMYRIIEERRDRRNKKGSV